MFVILRCLKIENEFEIYTLKGDDLKYDESYFVEINCIVCDRTFKKHRKFKDSRKTCCVYCTNYIIRMKKMTGYYSLCKLCDKPIWNRKSVKRTCCSKKCVDLYNKIIAPERYSDAKCTGHKKYYGPNWQYQRYLARERDNYNCRLCGISEDGYGKELSVHHKEPFVYFDNYIDANKLDNLLSLCEPCHRIIHSGDNHHSKFDVEKIKFKK